MLWNKSKEESGRNIVKKRNGKRKEKGERGRRSRPQEINQVSRGSRSIV